MIDEADLMILNTMEESQRANSEYVSRLREFGASFISQAKRRKLSDEETENALEAIITRVVGGNMRSVRQRMRENETKRKSGMLVPRDHDALYNVIGKILRARGWYPSEY